MKKKIWIAILAMIASLSFGATAVGCSNEGESNSPTSSVTESSTPDESSSPETDDSSSGGGEQVHTHSLTKVEGKAATCTEDGYGEYYTCDGCDKLFADAEGVSETTLDAVKIAAGHAYVEESGKEANYFEEGVKAHYTCENCDDKFLLQGEEYTVVTDEELVLAKKTIADETTASTVDTESADIINTVVADKVKQFDQTEPTYVTIANAAGESVQAIYFSRTAAWDVATDTDNNCGFAEFRIPVNAAIGGVSFTYKLLDGNNETCTTLDETDKAYGMKSYIEYKMNGAYVNVSKDTIGNICFMADGEWHDFTLECNQKNVEFVIFKIYHLEGELVVTNLQTLEAKHVHEMTEVPEKTETCTEDGNTTYYTCECGKFFADAEATQEIAENSWVLPAHHELSETLEYNETHHYYPCTKCDYQEETAHEMSEWGAEYIGERTRSCDCGYQETEEQSVEEIDFTKNAYGANVYSMELSVADPTRMTATANALDFLLWNDNNNTKALHQINLPRIDFRKYGKVVANVNYDAFTWEQQFGLTQDGLVNVSDTWVDWSGYDGMVSFTWNNEELVMTLAICNRILTKTITDADILSGKASACFYVQAYYERHVTLSNFAFIDFGDVNPYGDQYMAGDATVSGEQYDDNKRLIGLTVEIPGGTDWSKNPPLLLGSYLNQLYAEGINLVVIEATSTTTTNSFITFYNNVLDYDSRDGFVVNIIENGGDLKLSYVDLNNGGQTVATTLTVTISYQVDDQEDPQTIADEIGLTLYSGVKIKKDAEGVYTLSNMNGYQGGATFSAEQINAWIAEGYTSISMNVSFTAGEGIDTAVAYSASTSWVTDSTGNATWTFTLKEGEAIDFWAQKSGVVSAGAFTLSNIQLN